MCWLTGPSLVGTQLEGSVTVFLQFVLRQMRLRRDDLTWGLTSDAYMG